MKGRQLWIADALRKFGCTVILVSGWQTRGSSNFDPTGVLVHHTAAANRTKNVPSLSVCAYDGNSTTPAPLCQVLIGRDGACYVIASGRANHAGTGGPLPNIAKNNGNLHLFGIEAENDGVGEPWPRVQMEAFVAATAALLDGLKLKSNRCWSHKEWTPRKRDPFGIDMDAFRRDVANVLEIGEVGVPENLYPHETAEGLQLLTEHSNYKGTIDPPWFGPKALSSLHNLKNVKVELERRVQVQVERIGALEVELERTIGELVEQEAYAKQAVRDKDILRSEMLNGFLEDLGAALVADLKEGLK